VNDAIQPVPIESDGGVALSTERRAIGAEFGMATNGNHRRELVTTRQHRSLSQPSGAEPARVDVMVSGLPMQDPTSLIESDQMTELLLTLADDYDFVVFDSGSALLDPDAISLMKMVGRALIVGRLGVTSRDQAEMFRDDLRLLQVPTLGVIVNDTQPVSRRRAVLARRSLASGPVPTPSRLTQRSPSEQRSRADRDRAAAGRARRRADRAREDHAGATSE
jgi:Mrp family chromosome partitioning ATPase